MQLRHKKNDKAQFVSFPANANIADNDRELDHLALARQYEHGSHNVAKDITTAYVMYYHLASQGQAEAKARLEFLTASMPAAEWREAQNIIQKFEQ